MERIPVGPEQTHLMLDTEVVAAACVLMDRVDAARAGFPGLVRRNTPFPVAVGVNKAGFPVEARLMLTVKPVFEGDDDTRVLKNEEELREAAFAAFGILEHYEQMQSKK